MPPKKWGHLRGQRPRKEHIPFPKSATLKTTTTRSNDDINHHTVTANRSSPPMQPRGIGLREPIDTAVHTPK